MTTPIALLGAAGKMGTRLADKLRDDAKDRMLYVGAGKAGQARLRERGLGATSGGEAARQADVVILAVPDVVLGQVVAGVVPDLRSGAMVIGLDPAAPYSGDLPEREDIAYFIAHPCHPPVIGDGVEPDAQMDFFGGVAGQNVVCALMQGPEESYAMALFDENLAVW